MIFQRLIAGLGFTFAAVASAAAFNHEPLSGVDVFRQVCLKTAPGFVNMEANFEALNIWEDAFGDNPVRAPHIVKPSNMMQWRRGGAGKKAGGDLLIQYVEGTSLDADLYGCVVLAAGYSAVEAKENLYFVLSRADYLGEDESLLYGLTKKWLLNAEYDDKQRALLSISHYQGFGGPDSSQISLEILPDALLQKVDAAKLPQ